MRSPSRHPRPHTRPHLPRRPFRVARRRGTVYLLVLAGAMLVTICGIGAILAVKAQRTSVETAIQSARTRLAAQSMLEIGAACATNSAAWRSATAAISTLSYSLIGGCTVIVDAGAPGGGPIDTQLTSPMQLNAAASDQFSDAAQLVTAQITPTFTRITALDAALHSQGSITFSGATVYGTDPIGSNNSVAASTSTIAPPVYSGLVFAGGTYSGGTSTIATAKTMPRSDVFTYYVSIGTRIPIGSVGSRRIEKAVLSAANNPYGATNALGVYYIDCLGQDFQMRDCRVVGTLVLLNTSGLMIDSSVSLEPGASGLPSLLVQGGAQIQTSAGDLSETGLGANLNPVGTPYFGVSNNSQTDSYASVLAGVMYISGNVDLSASVAIDGCMIVGGRATIAGTLRLKRFVDVTPPCFETPTGFTVVESSIAKQVR